MLARSADEAIVQALKHSEEIKVREREREREGGQGLHILSPFPSPLSITLNIADHSFSFPPLTLPLPCPALPVQYMRDRREAELGDLDRRKDEGSRLIYLCSRESIRMSRILL
jgi:hypothetical protein